MLYKFEYRKNITDTFGNAFQLPFLDGVRLTGVGGADSVCMVSSTISKELKV